MLTGGTMPDRSSSTQLEDLPEEILVDGILLRLPSKDVGRCRAVCTAWRAATSTPEFMLKHHRRQPSLPIIDWKRRPHTCGVLTAGAGASIGTTSCQPALHWCPLSGGQEDIVAGGTDIIVFNTEAESFRWMRGPAQLCRSRHSKLFNLEGTLAFWGASTPSFTAMDVWVMQDYKAETWACKYRIDVSMLEASRQLYYFTSLKADETPVGSTVVQELGDMAVLNDRELLIMFNEKHVLRCGADGKYLGNVSEGKHFGETRYCRWFTGCRLQESIAPIPCHGMQAEDEEEDPFSNMGHV